MARVMGEDGGSKEQLPIAIIGSSYAGLTLGNILHLHPIIRYTIFDSKSLPYTYVCGGKFNIPAYETIAKKLELELDTQHQHHCNDRLNVGPTRQDIIESLLQRVKTNLITSRRIISIRRDEKFGAFYLHSVETNNATKEQSTKRIIYGPFRYVIGSDGVHSIAHKCTKRGIYLVGDARWAKDLWYDLGLQRIRQGANMAMIDGYELGKAFVMLKGDGQSISSTSVPSKFCACEIARWKRTKRRITFLMTALMIIIIRYWYR